MAMVIERFEVYNESTAQKVLEVLAEIFAP